MRHFLAQFGPCLAWPWTKLTDVVDLDDTLIEKIGKQSDEQAAGLSIRALERIRDEMDAGRSLRGPAGSPRAREKIMTPTLVKLSPSPARTIVGTLGQTQPVLQALGLEASAA